jgi:two-component sensor histidine kinase
MALRAEKARMAEESDIAARMVRLEADNKRLRRLLDEAGAPDGLRHGLRDTMAMLRAVLRLSAETADSVENYATHLEGRLDAIARVRVTADTFGEVNLHTLISDELMIHLIREGDQAALDGPAVRLRPKAAQLVALAIHELCSNAVEHGAFGLAEGGVEVRWSVDGTGATSAGELTLAWKETGGSAIGPPARQGFGMQVLTEMLSYELGARVDLAFEAGGLRCIIQFSLTPRVGHIVDETDFEESGEPG